MHDDDDGDDGDDALMMDDDPFPRWEVCSKVLYSIDSHVPLSWNNVNVAYETGSWLHTYVIICAHKLGIRMYLSF